MKHKILRRMILDLKFSLACSRLLRAEVVYRIWWKLIHTLTCSDFAIYDFSHDIGLRTT